MIDSNIDLGKPTLPVSINTLLTPFALMGKKVNVLTPITLIGDD
jgi:hypothetical protein